MSIAATVIKSLVTNRAFLTATQETVGKAAAGAAAIGAGILVIAGDRRGRTEKSLAEDAGRKDRAERLRYVCIDLHREVVSEYAKKHSSGRVVGRDKLSKALRDFMAAHGAMSLNAAMLILALEPTNLTDLGEDPTMADIERAVANDVNRMAAANSAEEVLPRLSIEDGPASRTTKLLREFRKTAQKAYGDGVRIRKITRE